MSTLLVRHPSDLKDYYAIGTKVKVVANASSHSYVIGTIVQIDQVHLPSVNSLTAYIGRNINSPGSTRYNFVHSDLEPVIAIKAYAYHHRSSNEFHWFSSEKDRKGYTRFISHDIESYK